MTFRKVTPRHGQETRYEVLVDGEVIGTVHSIRKQINKMHGRIRYPQGYETMWDYNDRSGRNSGIFQTRQKAAAALKEASQ